MNGVIALCFLGVLSFAAAQDCAQQVVDFVDCLKTQGQAAREAKRQQFEAKKADFEKCLTDNGCPPPPAAATGSASAGKGKGGGKHQGETGKHHGGPGFGNLTDTQKQCLKTQFETKAKAKLTQCLGHEAPAWLATLHDKFKQAHSGNNEHKGRWGKGKGHHGGAQCDKSKVKACFSTVFGSADHSNDKNAHCEAATQCENQKITGQCKTDFDEIKTKTCSCNHDSAAGAPNVADTFTACGIPLPSGGKHGGPRMQGPAASAVAHAATGKGKHGKRSFKPPYCKCIDNDADDDDDEDEDDDE